MTITTVMGMTIIMTMATIMITIMRVAAMSMITTTIIRTRMVTTMSIMTTITPIRRNRPRSRRWRAFMR